MVFKTYKQNIDTLGQQMNDFIDMTGKSFGNGRFCNMLEIRAGNAFAFVEQSENRCGNSLRMGRSLSCKRCSLAEKHPRTTHGKSRTRLHRIWLGMRRRCFRENDSAYPRYGGRVSRSMNPGMLLIHSINGRYFGLSGRPYARQKKQRRSLFSC